MTGKQSVTSDCTALIDRVAGAMWDSRRADAADPPWRDAPPFWREHFMQLAEVAVREVAR